MPNQNPTPEKQEKTAIGTNEGEGSRTAARRYNQGVEESVASGKTEELAEEAKDALEGDEGDELRDAEETAKHHGVGDD